MAFLEENGAPVQATAYIQLQRRNNEPEHPLGDRLVLFTWPGDQLHLFAHCRNGWRGTRVYTLFDKAYCQDSFLAISANSSNKPIKQIICSFLFEKQRKMAYESELRERLERLKHLHKNAKLISPVTVAKRGGTQMVLGLPNNT